jgi:hypothetical protein
MIKIKEIKNRSYFSKNFIRDSYWDIHTTISLLQRDRNLRKHLKVGNFDVKIRTQKNSLFISNYIKNNGKCKCEICGLEGKYFALERTRVSDNPNTYHFNLYTVDVKSKVEIYFNIDHIKPKSKGGRNSQDNLQLTCHICNTNKGNIFNEEKKKLSFFQKILILVKRIIK